MSYFNEKYAKYDFIQCSPDPLAGLKGSLLLRKGRHWEEGRGGTEGAAAVGPIGF